jgi:hypothetical protein
MGTYIAESLPAEDFKKLLEDNWVAYQKSPKPTIIVVNSEEDLQVRFDMGNQGDHVIIRTEGNENIRYRGNIQYLDKNYPIVMEIWTVNGRQRLRDIRKQIKNICLAHKWEFPNYQLIRFMNFTEMVNEEANIWRGVANIMVESAGVIAID